MTRLLAAAPLAMVALGGLPTTAAPVDQAAADAAVAVFNDRLTQAGWSSTGPLTQAQPEGDEEGQFGACLSGFERYLDYTDVHFEGETARAFSHDFELVSRAGNSTDATGGYGYAGAVVVTAADSAVGLLDKFVEDLGAADTTACMLGQPAFQSMTDEVRITNEADVGVGDASARLDFTVTTRYEDTMLVTAATFAGARVDRSLVVLVAGRSGPGMADLDLIAELAAMVDTLR